MALVRYFIDEHLLPSSSSIPSCWISLVPIKVNVPAWRLSLVIVPTRVNLDKCGLDIPTLLCPLCDVDLELTTHLFFSCPMVKNLTC